MAEIKSTLDLVMERTRNLTLTEDEKREQALTEFRQRFSGLTGRYLDGLLPIEGFRKELQSLRETVPALNGEILCDEIVRRLDPDRDNRQLLALLSEVCAGNTGGIESVLDEYAATLASMTRDRIDHVKMLLLDACKVSGSAVVPNLDADSDWAGEKEALREKVVESLAREIAAAKR